MSVARLTWSIDKGGLSYNYLAHQIRNSSLPPAVFFLDTAFLTDHEIPETVWDALRTRRVAITPAILYELQDWIATPFYNRSFRKDVVAAITGNSPHVAFLDPTRFPFNVQRAATYYTRLLGLRKQYPRMVKETLTEKGEPFSQEDFERICQQDLQDRGWRMAKKAMGDYGKPNFLADEELVVWAILYAIVTGSETMILTRDSDVLDQFYKAIYLLDSHYHSMLIADRYALHPWTFKHRRLEESLCWMREAYCGDEDALIRLPENSAFAFLPRIGHSVMLYCRMLRGQPPHLHCSGLTFCAEIEMARVLDAKAMTRGLNTVELRGNNCHVCPAPKHQHIFGGWGIVSKDVQIQWLDTRISVTDANLSILRIEKTAHVGAIHPHAGTPLF